MNVFCTQCGARVAASGTMFCAECGAALPTAFPESEGFSQSPKPPRYQTEVDLPSNVVDLPSNEVDLPSKVVDLPYRVVDLPVRESGHEKDRITVSSQRMARKPQRAAPPTGGRRLLFGAVSVVASLLLLVSVTAGQAWYILKSGADSQTLKTSARAAFDELAFSEFPVAELAASSVAIPGVEPGDEFDLHEVIYDVIDEYYIENYGVEQEHIKELLEHDIFNDFLGDILEGGVDYIMGGEDSAIMPSDKIINLIEDNKDEIGDITGYQLVDTDFEDIAESLKESGLDDLTWSTAINESGDGAAPIRDGFLLFERYSVLLLVGIIALIIGLVVLLLSLNRGSTSRVFAYIGIPCVISGLSVLIASFSLASILAFVAQANGIPMTSQFTGALVSDIRTVMLYAGLTVLGVGVVAIFSKVMVGSLNKKV